jgi:hypothetical protein
MLIYRRKESTLYLLCFICKIVWARPVFVLTIYRLFFVCLQYNCEANQTGTYFYHISCLRLYLIIYFKITETLAREQWDFPMIFYKIMETDQQRIQSFVRVFE